MSMGLCGSCQYIEICTYKKPQGGVYRCDKYVCGEPLPSEELLDKPEKNVKKKINVP